MSVDECSMYLYSKYFNYPRRPEAVLQKHVVSAVMTHKHIHNSVQVQIALTLWLEMIAGMVCATLINEVSGRSYHKPAGDYSRDTSVFLHAP